MDSIRFIVIETILWSKNYLVSRIKFSRFVLYSTEERAALYEVLRVFRALVLVGYSLVKCDRFRGISLGLDLLRLLLMLNGNVSNDVLGGKSQHQQVIKFFCNHVVSLHGSVIICL